MHDARHEGVHCTDVTEVAFVVEGMLELIARIEALGGEALVAAGHGMGRLVEDTVRFYALRLREARMIKSSPQKLIDEGTDWRFLNELKKELKG